MYETVILVAAVIATILFAALVIMASVMDSKTSTIPNWMVLAIAGVWVVQAAVIIVSFMQSGNSFVEAAGTPMPLLGVSLAEGLLSCVVFGVGALLTCLAFERITGSFAMGGGDVKLIAACALYLGFQGSLLMLIVACLTFAISSVVQKKGKMPFGPYIALGVFVALVLGMF